MTYNHYFYDYQGDIVASWLQSPLQIQKGDSVLVTDEKPVIYLVQARLYVQGESIDVENKNWLVNRLSKVIVNQPFIDRTTPREPLPLKSIQAYQQP